MNGGNSASTTIEAREGGGLGLGSASITIRNVVPGSQREYKRGRETEFGTIRDGGLLMKCQQLFIEEDL
jgi:hypothetical protein